jgi:hypothetical protein
MGTTDLVLNFGTVAVPDLKTFKSGINYDEFEVVELLLGSNNDTLTIQSTAENALTVVHGGGGDDNIVVVASGSASTATVGGANRTLAIFGDTTQDGQRYNSSTDAIDGSGRQFSAGGNDTIDVSAADGFVIVSGGVGDDDITSSNFNDHLLGGSGNDIIEGMAGNDHIYGDNGLNIDQSVRLDQQSQLISIVIEQDPAAAGFNAKTGDTLAAAGIDVISGSGDNIILTDFGLIEQIAGTNRAFDTGRIVSIQSQRESEGSPDIVNMHGGFDYVIGGQGGDEINIGTGGGAILGDNGQIDIDPTTQQLVQVATRNSQFGGGDTITAGGGATFVFGGSAGDVITTAGGDDVIAGDQGVLTFASGVRSLFTSSIETSAYGGDDIVKTGAGNDWVILGDGSDQSLSDSGLNIVIGDAGRIQAYGMTGVAIQIDTTQPTIGGSDTIIGGSDRDVQFGGADKDFLTGRAGNDLMQGDNGLLTRKTPFETGQWTFESTAIEVGDDDVLIGDTLDDASVGLDVMIGGIGNDSFSLSIGDDIVAGEFLRVRFVPHGDGTDRVTSFLTPALRDLDLLVQITLGVNLSSKSSVIVGPPEGLNIEFGFPTDINVSILERMDLLFLPDGLFGVALLEGLLSEDALDLVAGTQGFRLQSPNGVLNGGEVQTIIEETNGAAPSNEDAPTAPEVQQDAALDGIGTDFATVQDTADDAGNLGGWRMAGWWLGSSQPPTRG